MLIPQPDLSRVNVYINFHFVYEAGRFRLQATRSKRHSFTAAHATK